MAMTTNRVRYSVTSFRLCSTRPTHPPTLTINGQFWLMLKVVIGDLGKYRLNDNLSSLQSSIHKHLFC